MFYSKIHIRNFISVFQTQLYICHLNGLNYYYLDETGNKTCKNFTYTIYIICVSIFLFLTTTIFIKCPTARLDSISSFTSKLVHYNFIFYIYSSVVWFGICNKNLISTFEKLALIDGILLKLNQRINYTNNKMCNYLRILTLYCLLIAFIVYETIIIGKNNFNYHYCAINYYLFYYLSININCLFYTYIFELDSRMKMLRSCCLNIRYSSRNVKKIITVYILLSKLTKIFNVIFALHLLNKVLCLLSAMLYFSAYVVSLNLDDYWLLVKHIVTYSLTIITSILEMVIFIYLLESIKEMVSFLTLFLQLQVSKKLVKIKALLRL